MKSCFKVSETNQNLRQNIKILWEKDKMLATSMFPFPTIFPVLSY